MPVSVSKYLIKRELCRTCDVSLARSKYLAERRLVHELGSTRLTYCEMFHIVKYYVISVLQTVGFTVVMKTQQRLRWDQEQVGN